MSLPSDANGKTITFTLTTGADKTPTSLKASWESGSTGNETDVNDIVFLGDFSDVGVIPSADSDKWSTTYGTVKDNDNEYHYTFEPTKTGKAYFRFKINGIEYCPKNGGNAYLERNNWDHDNAKSKQGSDGTWYFEVTDINKTYTILFRKNNGDPRVNGEVKDKPKVDPKIALPVFPIGVEDEAGLTADVFPVYYLSSTVLNNNRVTSEYQFVKATASDVADVKAKYGKNITEGTYFLVCTMRNTKTDGGDGDWLVTERNIWVKGFVDATSLNTEHAKTTWNKLTGDLATGGITCVVTFDPVNDKLNFDEVEGTEMPFVSLIGAEWKQRSKAVTPNSSATHPEDTQKGWQEAWVQYNDKEVMDRDRNGNVMYNTLMPPVNPILFKTEFTTANGDDYNFTLSSDALVLAKEGKKTGKEWKQDDRFKEYVKTGTLPNTDVTELDGLVLNDETSYSLYKVPSMWINGRFKLWTGWGGFAAESNGSLVANWSNHINWGHQAEGGSGEAATTITPAHSVPTSNREGDMTFGDPKYFDYVYFFLADGKASTKGENVIFTTLALGGAQIGAATQNYEQAFYQPGLTDLANVTEGHVKSVRIESYNSAKTEKLSDVFELRDIKDKTNPDFHTLFGTGKATDDNNSSKANWVTDSFNYPNGIYYYKMTVVLTTDAADSKEQTIEVWSNPFRIFRQDVASALTAYQLVEKVGEEGKYVTFRAKEFAEGSESKYVEANTPAYEVTVASDGKISYTILSELPDYGDSSKYKFTNKAIFVGNIPNEASVKVNNYAFDAKSADDTFADDDFNKAGMAEYGNRFMSIAEVCDLAKKSYKLQLDYDISFYDAEGKLVDNKNMKSTAGHTDFALTVPEPELKEATIDFFYGSDNTADTDDETGTFSFRGHELTGARYQNLREHVEVEMPNADGNLGNMISSAWKVKLAGEELTLTDGVYNGEAKAPIDVYVNNYTDKDVTLAEFSHANVYKRFNGGKVYPIELSSNAPNGLQAPESSVYFSYNDKGSLEENITLTVKMSENDNIKNVITRRDKDFNVVGGNENKPRMHAHSDNDYYYITVVEKETDKVLVDMVKSFSDLKAGVKVNFIHNWGHWWNGLDKLAVENPYYKKTVVRASYLYPFTGTVASKAGMSRVNADITTEAVVKSMAMEMAPQETPTSVDGIDAGTGATVKAGTGYIEVVADGEVEIYSADGLKVATGAGRHDLSAGVYMVRVDGSVQKVVVR